MLRSRSIVLSTPIHCDAVFHQFFGEAHTRYQLLQAPRRKVLDPLGKLTFPSGLKQENGRTHAPAAPPVSHSVSVISIREKAVGLLYAFTYYFHATVPPSGGT